MTIERHAVLFPTGDEYMVGGQLLCSDEVFKKIAPDLFAALESGDDSGESTNEKVYQIVKFYNPEDPDLNSDSFVSCMNSAQKVMKIWIGAYEPEKKTS